MKITLEEFRREQGLPPVNPSNGKEIWTVEQYRNYLNYGTPNPKTKGKRKSKKQPLADIPIPETESSKPSKYRNKKVEYDGIVFDSKKEAEYYKALQLLVRIGEVVKFERQVPYVIKEGYVNGEGKKIRPIKWIADFVVTYTDGHEEIVDTKGYRTKDFLLKKKLFEERYYPQIIKLV